MTYANEFPNEQIFIRIIFVIYALIHWLIIYLIINYLGTHHLLFIR